MAERELLYVRTGMKETEAALEALKIVKRGFYDEYRFSGGSCRSDYQSFRFMGYPDEVLYFRDIKPAVQLFLEDCGTGIDLMKEMSLSFAPSPEQAINSGFSVDEYSRLYDLNWITLFGKRNKDPIKGCTFTLSQPGIDIFLSNLGHKDKPYFRRLHQKVSRFNGQILQGLSRILG